MEVNKLFVCSSCDICHEEKSAELMCTCVMENNELDKTCWCVCKDCLPIVAKINEYYVEGE